MKKIDIKSCTLSELEKTLNLPKFRSKQIFHWLHQKHVTSFNEMTNISFELRNELENRFYIYTPKIKKTIKSKDGTIKYLLELEDCEHIECVVLRDRKGRQSVCVSSQVGCALGCHFCATAKMGFTRNLSVSEILSQVYLIAAQNCKPHNHKTINNIVFMGMGEPFLNYDNVLKAIKILNFSEGINIGARKITISTCGFVDGIRKLAEEEIQVRLAVSLNAAVDKIRSLLMPINNTYPLRKLREAILFYQKKTGRRVTLEYILLDCVNDYLEDLESLADFCRGLNVNVNLVPYNFLKGTFKGSPKKIVEVFINELSKRGIEVVERISRGGDIEAGCGQLAFRA